MYIFTLNRAARVIVIAMLTALTSLSVAFGQSPTVIEKKLDNGLVVLIKEVHAAPVFTAQVWFKVGSRNEHNGITGISHLLEHMQFNSSKDYKKGEITKLLRKRGGIDNAATWTDFTYYWEMLSDEHLDFAMKTLAQKMGLALLLDDELQKERTVVLSELEGNENDPDRLLGQEVESAAFKVSPYHWPTIGWRSDVENIDDAQLKDYYHTYYCPNNATLVVVGDVKVDQVMALAKKYYGAFPVKTLPKPVYTTEPTQHGERTVTIRRQGSAERVMLCYHIPPLTDKDTYPLMVLDQILSGGRSGRLYQALVERQLATSAWSDAGSRRDTSLFSIGATARQGVTADNLEKALLEQVEIAKIVTPTDKEMQRAKNQLEAYFVFQNDGVSEQGEQLGYYNTVDTWQYHETLIPRLKAVSADQVQAVAKKYLNQDNLTEGKFIPSGRPTGGGEAPGIGGGALHRSTMSGTAAGPSYYRRPGSEPGMSASNTSPDSVSKSAKPYRTVLPNGMVVIVQENHSNPTIAVSGNLKAGSCFEPNGKTGTASLVADIIQRGTKTRSALELASSAEFVGASLNASANAESASFEAKSLSKDFPLMLDLLSDELRNANFPEDQFELAKGEMASQLEESKESPAARANRAFRESVFPPGHPYHELSIEDAEKELKSITRDDLASFYSNYYRPDTAIIVIVGDITAKDAVNQVSKFFGDWKASGPTPKVEIPTVPAQSESKKIVIPMMDKSEVSVILGHAMGLKRTDPDFYAARIMNQILGGGGALGSLLGDEIREKQGLVYDVRSVFDATLGAGPWYASLGTNPKNADKAMAALEQLIREFKEKGATKAKFEEAREFIIGVLPIALETNEGLAGAILNAEFNGVGVDYLSNFARIYRGVTLEQVNAAAKKYLHPEAETLVIAGPYQGK